MLAVLSFGYRRLQEAVTNETAVSAWVLLAIAIGKILTTGLTIGSGGSGGVFGPSMVIGGCGGGALGPVVARLVAHAGSASGELLSSSGWPAFSPPPPKRLFPR